MFTISRHIYVLGKLYKKKRRDRLERLSERILRSIDARDSEVEHISERVRVVIRKRDAERMRCERENEREDVRGEKYDGV